MSRSIVRYDSVGPSKNSENLSSKEDQRILGRKSLTDRWIDKEASHLKDYLSVSQRRPILVAITSSHDIKEGYLKHFNDVKDKTKITSNTTLFSPLIPI